MPSTSPKNRSLSVEKYKNLSGEVTPKVRHRSTTLRSRNLRSSSKLMNGHPNPGDIEEAKETRQRKEVIQGWFERGVSEMKIGEFPSAISFFSKILKEDPKNVDSLFNRACCYMNVNEHKLAIPDLMVLSTDFPLYKKKLYVALAMCFANLHDFESGIRHLSRGLLKYPKFTEGFVTRGQFYLQQTRWEKAVQDFYKAISLNPAEGSAYIGLGDAYLGFEDKKNAIKAYSQAVQCTTTSFQALIKRGKIFFELQDFSKSLNDLELALSYNSEDPEAYYYKSMILLSQDNLTEAALCLEQVIKFDVHSRKYTGAAIYDLGAIKIKQKDYYGAMHTFKRASDINVEVKEQKVLRGYVEAILLLMKRKFKEGISQLSRIIKKKEQPIQEYIGNCYAFRGYGYASLEKHDQAVRNLNNASKIQELDNASKYNLQISNAWLISEKSPEESLKMLEDAFKDFSKNPEPLAYQAAIHLSQSRKTSNKKLAEKSKSLLDKAITLRDSDCDLYFFRGITLYYLSKPIEAVPDYELAIDKAEDNVPIHFIARGLCYAQLKLLKEAMQDFSIAIQLNESMSDAYYFRGRCAFLLDDTQQAFQDYQKMITNKNDDPVSHINAGNLLLLAGSVEDASKAYTNANSISPTQEAFLQRAKCYLMMEKHEQTISDLESALKLGSKVEVDIELLKIITNSGDFNENNLSKKVSAIGKLLHSQVSEKVFKMKHLHWYKGVFLFMVNEFQKAKVEFKAALDTKYDSEETNTDKDNSEVLFNLALCYVMCEQYEAALIHLQELVYILEGSDRGKILLLIGVLNLVLQENEQARSIMLEAFKYDSVTSTAYLEEKPLVEILPFSSNSTLSQKYPKKEVKIQGCHPFHIRPSFSYPSIALPSLDFHTEASLLNEFLVKSIKCKPEAPWLNRVKGTIQFTEEIREINCESVISSLKNESDDENSVFDSSFSDLKVFRSVQIMSGKHQVSQETAELFNYVKPKEKPSKAVIVDASEQVRNKIDSICSSNFDD
jgi:tetratricopeptide (TPR) repeat protein